MRILIVFAALVLANNLAKVESYAIPLHTLDVRALTQKANTIVVGTVTKVETEGQTTIEFQGGPLAATRYSAWLEADRVIKGNLNASIINIKFLVPNAPVGISGVAVNQFGIFFLDTNEDVFRFADDLYPSLPAVPFEQRLVGSPLDQVTETLGFALVSPQASTTTSAKAVRALSSIRSDYSMNVLRNALSSTTGNLRLDIARTLVADNDVAGLDIVKTALLQPEGLSPIMIMNLKGSLLGMKDPNAIPALAMLAKSSDIEIRRNAAAALRQTGSWTAVSPLARLLTVNDMETQYYAVVGLGEITKENEWTPSYAEFQEKRNRYISHWVTWREDNLH